MEITKADWEKTVEALAHARLRPQMYFSDDNLSVMNFRFGLLFGLGAVGIDIQEEEVKIFRERGWKINAFHPIREMQEQGMSVSEINIEVITMLILAIQRLFEVSNEPILKTHNKMRDHILKTHEDMQSIQPNELSIYNNRDVVESTRSRHEGITQLLNKIEREMENKENE